MAREAVLRIAARRVKDLCTGQELPGRLENVSSFAWAADGRTLT